MINPSKEIDWSPDRAALRKFGVSLVIGFPLLAGFLFLVRWGLGGQMPEARSFVILAAVGLAIGVLALVLPTLARPFYWLWYGFAACVGIVVSNLILVLVYYLLFAPIGWLRRMAGNNPLQLGKHPDAKSYWHTMPEPPKPADYFTQS